MPAETRKAAQQAIAQFEADYGAKYPKAVASLRRDESELCCILENLVGRFREVDQPRER